MYEIAYINRIQTRLRIQKREKKCSVTAFGDFAQHGARGMRLLRVPVSNVYKEAEPLLAAAPSFEDLTRVYGICNVRKLERDVK